MKFHTLAVYSFKVKDNNHTYKNMVDIFENLSECFNGMNERLKIDDKAKKSYKVHIRNNTHQEIAGIIETGHYGTAEPIVDVLTEIQSYEKKTTEADMEPHYFLLQSKGLNRNSGFLISERIGNDGIETILETIIKLCLRDWVIETEPVLTKGYVKTKLDNLKDIRLTKFIPSTDLSSEIRQDTEGTGLYLETRIRSEKNKLLPFSFKRHLIQFLEDPNAKGIFTIANDVIRSALMNKDNKESIDDLDFDYLTVTVKIGGTERKIKMQRNEANMRPYFELPVETSYDEKGWPRFEDIDRFAKQLITDILTDSGNQF